MESWVFVWFPFFMFVIRIEAPKTGKSTNPNFQFNIKVKVVAGAGQKRGGQKRRKTETQQNDNMMNTKKGKINKRGTGETKEKINRGDKARKCRAENNVKIGPGYWETDLGDLWDVGHSSVSQICDFPGQYFGCVVVLVVVFVQSVWDALFWIAHVRRIVVWKLLRAKRREKKQNRNKTPIWWTKMRRRKGTEKRKRKTPQKQLYEIMLENGKDEGRKIVRLKVIHKKTYLKNKQTLRMKHNKRNKTKTKNTINNQQNKQQSAHKEETKMLKNKENRPPKMMVLFSWANHNRVDFSRCFKNTRAPQK